MHYDDEMVREELLYILFRLKKYNRMATYWEEVLRQNAFEGEKLSQIELVRIGEYTARIASLISELGLEFTENLGVLDKHQTLMGAALIFHWSDTPIELSSRYVSFKEIWPKIEVEMNRFKDKKIKFQTVRLEALTHFAHSNDEQPRKFKTKQFNLRLDSRLHKLIDGYNIDNGFGKNAKAKFIHDAIRFYFECIDHKRLKTEYHEL